MRKHHPPLALAIMSLAIAAASLPGADYARKSLMEYGGRHAGQAHGRHAVPSHRQSAGNGNRGAGPAFSSFPGQGRGLAYGFGHGHAPAWAHRGGNGARGFRPGAGVNADYLLITMRNGVKLQGNLLARLAWSSGFALQPVMSDPAGNYLVSVRGRRGAGSNDPTALLASIKTNPNVLDASQAFMGQTRQLTAAPGDSVSVAASDLIGSVAATSYQWTQLSGTPVQLAQPADGTLSLTLPQTTTAGTADPTDPGTSAVTPPLNVNRYRLHAPGFRSALMQTAHWHGHGYGHQHGHGHGHGKTQLVFELIAKDSADRAYLGKVVINVQPAASATPGDGSTGPGASGGTGSTDPGASDGTGGTDSGSTGDTGAADPGNGTVSTDPGSGGTDPGASGSSGGSTDDPGSADSGSGATGTGTSGSGAVIDGSVSAA